MHQEPNGLPFQKLNAVGNNYAGPPMSPEPTGDRATWKRRLSSLGSPCLLLPGILLITLLLRLLFLGQKSLWLDEIWSIEISRVSWRSLLWIIQNQDPNMSLYYCLLHVWMRLGESESIIRGLSVMMAVATVPALYELGRRLFGKSAGLIASVLLAVNLFHIQWSQEARGYSLTVLLVTLSCLFFAMSIERPRLRNWLGYVLASVLAISAHAFGVFVLAAQWASLMVLRRRYVPWKGLITSSASIGLLAGPLIVLFYDRTKAPLGLWITKPTLHDAYDLFYSLAGNASFKGSNGSRLLLVGYFILCCVCLRSWIRLWRSSGRSVETWRYGLLFAWLFLPIVLDLGISLIHPIYVSRYLLMCLPPLTLIAAQGFQQMKPRWGAAVALGTILSLAALGLPQYYQYRSSNQEWRSTTDYILSKARPGDAVFFCIASGRLLFDYYRKRYHGGFDAGLEFAYPAFDDQAKDQDILRDLPPLSSSRIDSVATRHPRVWVVLYHDQWAFSKELSDRIRAGVAARFPKVQERQIDGVTVLLYSSDRPDEKEQSSDSIAAPVVLGAAR